VSRLLEKDRLSRLRLSRAVAAAEARHLCGEAETLGAEARRLCEDAQALRAEASETRRVASRNAP
jgi:hypothetical protein